MFEKWRKKKCDSDVADRFGGFVTPNQEMLYCLVCGFDAESLDVNPARVVHRIEIPSCVTSFGDVRVIYICVECSDHIRDFLNGPAKEMTLENLKRLREGVKKLKV